MSEGKITGGGEAAFLEQVGRLAGELCARCGCQGDSEFWEPFPEDWESKELREFAEALNCYIAASEARARRAQGEALEREQKFLAAERERFTIIESLSRNYFCSFYIDTATGLYRELKSYAQLRKIIPREGSIAKAIRLWLDSSILPEFHEPVVKFMKLGTLAQRMKGRDSLSIEYRSSNKGWCQGILTVVDRGGDGSPQHVLFSVRDINEDKQREFQSRQALQEAFDAADKASAAKTRFLSNMSHDIRTPMNAIIGMTAIAAANIGNAERVADCLHKITVSSRHLMALINEVLDMSKIESGKVDLVEEEFSLGDLFDSLITMLRPQIEAKRHELKVTVRSVRHEKVIGDSLRIQQVFTNLASNAVKYTPEGGLIRISIEEKPSRVAKFGCYEFVFEDNGIGMSKEFIPHLFEPFARADDAHVAGIQGTGLGMPIARNIVRMMNGNIQVQSELGRGTKFTVTIFLRLQDDEEISTEAFADLPVLVADDDEAACQTTCAVLDEMGMKSEWVLSGGEAVELAARRHEEARDFFSVILDWKMPGMDGIETTRRIRKRLGDDVPIIIISAYDWSDIEFEARAAGANAFVCKPLFKSRMASLFDELLGRKDEAAEERTLSDMTAAVDFSGRRVLLVEDNEINAEITAEILGMAKIQVEFARDGRQAVDKVASVPDGYYDMILMDIQMPVMNGYDATRAIRAMDRAYAKSVPIVAMTANAFSDDVAAARNAGMNEHIAKPLKFELLVDALKRWL